MSNEIERRRESGGDTGRREADSDSGAAEDETMRKSVFVYLRVSVEII